jgi:hypothetical protein
MHTGSIVKAALERSAKRSNDHKAPPRHAHQLEELRIHRPDASCPIGLELLLSPQPVPGAVILKITPFGRAWRATLRPGDAIQKVLCTETGREWSTETGRELTAIAPSLVGEVIMLVLRRPRSRKDAYASRIQATWAGYATRLTLHDNGMMMATGGSATSRCSSPESLPSPTIRSPPRLWDDDDSWRE